MSFDGMLRDSIQLLQRTLGAADDTGHQVETWTTGEICRARIDPAAGKWVFDLSVNGYVPGEFVLFMREPAGGTLDEVNWRILWNGETYRILRVPQLNAYAAKHHLELDIKVVHERKPS